MDDSSSHGPCGGIAEISCTALVCAVSLLLAGCNETIGTAPPTIMQDIGAFIEDGDVVEGARHVWDLAGPHVDVAVTGIEVVAGDAAGLVDTVSGVADSTLEQSITGSRIGIDTGYREGALAGALAGSMAGLLSGPWVVRHHAFFLATRKSLDEEIAFQRDVARSLGRNITITKAVLTQHRREIARLGKAHEEDRAEIRAWERARGRIEADRRTIRALIVRTDRSIIVLEERIESFREADLDTSPLEEVEAERQQAVENLRAIEDALVALIADVPLDPIAVSTSNQPYHLP